MAKTKLILGNCLEVLPKIKCDPARTVIITSPPYNLNLRIGRKNNYKSTWDWKGTASHFTTKYGNYKDDLPMEDYYAFQKEFLDIALEKADLVFYNIQMVTGNKVALCNLLGTFSTALKEVIIWDKMLGQPAVRAGCLNSRFEFIFVFSKRTAIRRMFEDPLFERGKLDNLWTIRAGKHKSAKAGFPEDLVKTILTNFVPKTSFVIDPFLGGGTTAVVCQKLGYYCVGIEYDKETYEIAQNRLNEEAENE